MSGRFVTQIHECETPSIGSHAVGTIWQCECSTYYKVIYTDFRGHKKWVPCFWRTIFGAKYPGDK